MTTSEKLLGVMGFVVAVVALVVSGIALNRDSAYFRQGGPQFAVVEFEFSPQQEDAEGAPLWVDAGQTIPSVNEEIIVPAYLITNTGRLSASVIGFGPRSGEVVDQTDPTAVWRVCSGGGRYPLTLEPGESLTLISSSSDRGHGDDFGAILSDSTWLSLQRTEDEASRIQRAYAESAAVACRGVTLAATE